MNVLHTSIFTDPTGCGKLHLVSSLTEKSCDKYFNYNIIILPTLQWKKIFHVNEIGNPY